MGTDIEPELSDLIRSSEIAKAVNQEPFATILERQYRPHLVMAIAIPFFQQTTGIKIFAFYAPILFQSVGFGHDSAFLAAIVVGLVEMGSILASSTVVDRFGRRFLFLVGGILMFICQVCLYMRIPVLNAVEVSVACVLAAVMGVSGTNHIFKGYGILVLILMCLYVAGFGCSWGTLTWLIPSEIFPMKIRTTGQSISIAINFATTSVLSQTFLTMLCHFKFATFLFYAGWILNVVSLKSWMEGLAEEFGNKFSDILGTISQIFWAIWKQRNEWIFSQQKPNAVRTIKQAFQVHGDFLAAACSQKNRLAQSTAQINGALHYTVNNVSYLTPATPLKLADYSLNGSGVYQIDEFPVNFSNPVGVNGTFVVTGIHRGWLEIVFRNGLDVMDSWHLDGFGFYVVG
ncbi:hypothetical protein RHGRI_016696 [Rhododendron griersonianum]|uniref:Major facilitator superfamily (MFS) profile domain-containing protein n=1 Tax=Rhododendron griersonianum TaxID=479676 RepID=A0AAV6JV44_9ERIC|nr:hypothetical protein RHGRI_016696 [Rhododendron griersonianum]